MLAVPPKSDNGNRRDNPYAKAAWLGILLLGGAILYWLSGQNQTVLNPNEHDGPPPNWGNPPIYPGGYSLLVRTGDKAPLAPYMFFPGTDIPCAPTRQITYYVAAPPDAVIEWYRQRFTAEGWHYQASASIGLGMHYVTSGFWKYNWYEKNAMGATHSMDIETSDPDPNRTSVNILLGRFGDNSWAGH